MKPPSDELTAMSDASKPNPEQTIREWALLLGKLQIKYAAFISGVTDQLAHEVGWELDIDDDSIFDMLLFSQSQQLVSGEDVENPIYASFVQGDQAVIKYFGGGQLDPVVTPFIGFCGTWEEVARKLFELEKLMLEKASAPETPKDL